MATLPDGAHPRQSPPANGQRVGAIYARVSTEDQGKGYSLPTQVAGARELLEREGYLVPAHYIFSDDVTGTTLERPGLRQLRALVTTRAIRAVGIYDPDRLSRTLGHHLFLAEEAERAGVQLLFVTQTQDRSPEGWLFFQIRGAVAEYERTKILERIQRGLKGRAQAGSPGGGQVPLGYTAMREPHKARWEIDPEETALVQRIFALCLEGMPCQRIAWLLTSERIPTVYDRRPESGGTKAQSRGTWQPGTVQHILTNETYIGTAYWRDRRSGEQIAIPVPAIVDAATFAAVQAQLARNKQGARRNRRREYLLAGRLRCAACGRAMSGYPTPRARRYRCTSASQLPAEARCRRTVKADDIERWVWSEVEKRLRDPQLIAQEIARQEASAHAQLEDAQHDITLLDAALARCDQEDARWLRAYGADAISEQELKGYREGIAKTRQGLLQDRAQRDARLQAVHLSRTKVRALEAYCARLGATLTRFDLAEKQHALEQLDVQVTWAPTQPLRIRMTLPDEDDALVTPAREHVAIPFSPLRHGCSQRHPHTTSNQPADQRHRTGVQ
jgi:site-specific DNA recombinase